MRLDPKFQNSREWLASLAFAGALALPSIAEAAEVDVSLAEDDNGVTVRIRGLEPNAQADHIVTSKVGALLFVPGDDAMAQRMRPLERHRLDYVQVGRAGQRVAVRVVQRKKAKGMLWKHMTTTPVSGGFDVRIEDAPERPIMTIAAALPTTVATTDRATTLARIAGDAPSPAPAAAPPLVRIATAPVAPTPTAIAPSPAPITPVAAPTVAAAEPADAPAPSEDDTRWAAASTQQGQLELGRSAPQIGLAWLATAMLAFSGLGLVWWRRRRPLLDTPQPLRVMARVSIGPKQQIVWLSAGGRSLLVGSTEHRIELLADLTASPAEATAAIMTQAMGAEIPAPAPAPAADGKLAAFKQRLRAALGDELAGRNEELLPPHLEMLAGDPRWVGIGRKDAA